MPSWTESYPRLIALLNEHYGPPPVHEGGEDRSPFEAGLAAALGVDIGASRRSPVIAALDRAGLLEATTLAAMSATEVRDAVVAIGFALTPADALQVHRFAKWFADRLPDEADARDEAAAPTADLRDALLAVKGIGQATADSILLAMGRPSYPIDRATFRILVRHGWADGSTEYDEARAPIVASARGAPAELAELSYGLARIGRQFCGPRTPKCARCPLQCLLPDGGPLEPEG
ncbi:Ultraviolet N-glycosylase/AP lyase [Aquisphaera giovannonii]|uniref:Ultraviolet N-glycosylase/AP lyase n=1 Tax=Aquisphaera giovannonii TaxID=406548 RepID=A0A5B9W0D1_9BACT|nr:endonuclease III [Aquisphaera giovannonii]QEH34008.1 Ultraviolet N-glycosylase/AP lyase [Aquisphaera giovannonii]